jgi:hypothetical protein
MLQTGRPYGAQVFPIHSHSTNRSPLRGSGVPYTFSFYKQVAATRLKYSRSVLILQAGRRPLLAGQVLRGSEIDVVTICYKQDALTRFGDYR